MYLNRISAILHMGSIYCISNKNEAVFQNVWIHPRSCHFYWTIKQSISRDKERDGSQLDMHCYKTLELEQNNERTRGTTRGK